MEVTSPVEEVVELIIPVQEEIPVSEPGWW